MNNAFNHSGTGAHRARAPSTNASLFDFPPNDPSAHVLLLVRSGFMAVLTARESGPLDQCRDIGEGAASRHRAASYHAGIRSMCRYQTSSCSERSGMVASNLKGVGHCTLRVRHKIDAGIADKEAYLPPSRCDDGTPTRQRGLCYHRRL